MDVEKEEYGGRECKEKGRIWGKEKGGRGIFEGRYRRGRMEEGCRKDEGEVKGWM
jgi:hypothetical protein